MTTEDELLEKVHYTLAHVAKLKLRDALAALGAFARDRSGNLER